MAASIDITNVGTATVDNKYQVAWTATSEVEMPAEIFVYTYATRTYNRVAGVNDLLFPTSPDATKAWYRSATASEIFDDLTEATAAKVNVSAAVQSLVDAYNSGLVTFLTPVTTSFT
jgi:hypothetical protein